MVQDAPVQGRQALFWQNSRFGTGSPGCPFTFRFINEKGDQLALVPLG